MAHSKVFKPDAIIPLIENVLNTSYDDIPVAARDTAKRCILDTLGAIIAGSSTTPSRIVCNMVKEWGGREESTVFLNNARVPAPNAVWANATMARAWEIDDDEEITGAHASVATVTSAIAAAEMLGGANGRDIITAIVLGTDLVIRIIRARKHRPIVFGTIAYSVFPSVCVAGKLLGFDKEKMLNAMGLALTQMSATLQIAAEGVPCSPVCHGIGARAGVLAALMASKGMVGPHQVLQGKLGVYPVYEHNEFDINAPFVDLGKEFLITQTSVKPYSSCKQTHSAIQGTIELVQKHNIRPGDISAIRVRVSQHLYEFVCDGEAKRNPKTIAEAQFSLPWAIGTAAVHHDVFIGNYTEEGIRDPEVLKLVGKIEIIVDPKLSAVRANMVPTPVEIEAGGKTYSTLIAYVRGTPQNPMSFEDCIEKFRKCTAFSSKPLSGKRIDELIDTIGKLETMPNVGAIPRLLL